MVVQGSPRVELEILIRGIDSPYSWGLRTPKNHVNQSEGVVARRDYGFPACEWLVGPSLASWGGPIIEGPSHAFWGSTAPGSRGNRFPVSKYPIPPLETFVRSYLTRVFAKKHFFNFSIFYKNLHQMWP